MLSLLPLASILLFLMLLDLKPYAWPIIIYSKQDISQLRDECKALVEKLFGNSEYTFSSIYPKPMPEARVSVTQKQYATLRNPKMYPHTKFWISTLHNKQIRTGLDLSRTVARAQGHKDP